MLPGLQNAKVQRMHGEIPCIAKWTTLYNVLNICGSEKQDRNTNNGSLPPQYKCASHAHDKEVKDECKNGTIFNIISARVTYQCAPIMCHDVECGHSH
jgi:hypothetical protein